VSPTSNERRQVIYYGRVQGVGFRYTARQFAQSHAVTGFVKNLENGTVQLVAEGAPEVLDQFLAEIARRMGSRVRRTDVMVGSATGEFSAFEIAY
jgi:acylphosphatase